MTMTKRTASPYQASRPRLGSLAPTICQPLAFVDGEEHILAGGHHRHLGAVGEVARSPFRR